jgi:hypothetical protein
LKAKSISKNNHGFWTFLPHWIKRLFIVDQNVLKWHSPTLKKRGDEMKKYDFIANF